MHPQSGSHKIVADLKKKKKNLLETCADVVDVVCTIFYILPKYLVLFLQLPTIYSSANDPCNVYH